MNENKEEVRKHHLIADKLENHNIPYNLPPYTPAMQCYNTTTVSTTLTAYEVLQALQQFRQPDLNSIILDALDHIYYVEDLMPIFEKSLALIEFKGRENDDQLVGDILREVDRIRNTIKSTNAEEYAHCEKDIKILTQEITDRMRKLVRYRDAAKIYTKLREEITDVIS